jgi:DNA polymerase-3 subunit alpha
MEICLLETIKRSLTRQIQFNINPKLFTVNQFSFIERNIKKNPGKTRLKFVFHEKKDQKMVVLSTIDKGFEMNDEMAAFLLENPDMEVNVDTA